MNDMYKYTTKVAGVIDNFKFVINKGSNDKVEVGDNYLIFFLGEVVSDPDTGDELGVLEHVKGRARVTHVQDRMATLESVEKETIPGKIRKIERDSENWFLGRPRREVVEEGSEVKVRPLRTEVGDFARPV